MTNYFKLFLKLINSKVNKHEVAIKEKNHKKIMEKNLREISDDLIDLCENIKVIEEPFHLEKIS